MPVGPLTLPTLVGAGSFIGSNSCGVGGELGFITIYPNVKQPINGFVRVTIQSDDGYIPALSVSDDDGSTFVSVTTQFSNKAQFTFQSIANHLTGGNKIKVVFPNAVHKAFNPVILVEYFN